MNPEKLAIMIQLNEVYRVYLACKDVIELVKVTEEEKRARLFRCPYHMLVPSILVVKAELLSVSTKRKETE